MLKLRKQKEEPEEIEEEVEEVEEYEEEQPAKKPEQKKASPPERMTAQEALDVAQGHLERALRLIQILNQ